MRNITVILTIMFISSCIFIPEEAQKPDGGKFIDRLNLDEIVSGTTAYFPSFRNYRELFEESGNFFFGADQKQYSSQEFIDRLNDITADTTIECHWTPVQSGEEFISISGTTPLRARNFRITSQNFPDAKTGIVRITVKKTETSGWLITKWEETNEEYSYFHPVFGDNLGN